MVGDVSEAELRPLLEATLGRWKRGRRAAPPLAAGAGRRAAPDRPRSRRRTRRSRTCSSACPGCARSSDDYVAGDGRVPGARRRHVLAPLPEPARGEGLHLRRLRARATRAGSPASSFVVGSVKAEVTGAALKELLARARAAARRARAGAASSRTRRTRSCSALPADFATAGGDRRARSPSSRVHGLPDDYWNRLRRRGPEGRRPRTSAASRRRYLDPAKLTRRDGREPGRGAAAARRPAARADRGAARTPSAAARDGAIRARRPVGASLPGCDIGTR